MFKHIKLEEQIKIEKKKNEELKAITEDLLSGVLELADIIAEIKEGGTTNG